jgi:hypothetical protein
VTDENYCPLLEINIKLHGNIFHDNFIQIRGGNTYGYIDIGAESQQYNLHTRG